MRVIGFIKSFLLLVTLLFSLLDLSANEFMAVDELKPGMKGYGLTVFKGTAIDTFDVEIVDIMKNDMIKGDIILAKISGKVVDTAGVISGMSGSPIYIYASNPSVKIQKSKLIGALAYSFTIFAKEHLAGITPINEMLKTENRRQKTEDRYPKSKIQNPKSQYQEQKTEDRGQNAGDRNQRGAPPRQSGISAPLQLKLPISCDWLPTTLLDELETQFPNFYFLKTQSSGVKDDSLIPSPGSALGIPFVVGDIVLGVIGTCTYKEGNKIYAFGHPLAALGETDLPMTAGYIYSVVSSGMDSYKLGVPTKIIGTIKNDNSRGIVGEIGKMPNLVEMNLMLNGELFHYQIIKEKTFLSFLFKGLVFYSIGTQIKLTGDITAEATLEITGSKNFSFKTICTGAPENITNAMAEIFDLIQNNPFQKIDIHSIRIDLITSDTIKLAKIDAVIADKKEVAPGDSLNLLISLLTYRGSKVKKHLKLAIPQCVKKGTLLINIEEGRMVRNQARSHITTIDELQRWLSTSPKDNEIIITLTQKGKSSWIGGQEFHSLPPSIVLFMEEGGKTSNIQGENKLFELRIPTEWVITQKKTIELEVK
ncbi:MAG: hypothetical protein HY769_09070 [Candidatus Stahlbacteria bacterium]|nr:hypothetical protein [Candidatus Stahlbacteria bacterium]